MLLFKYAALLCCLIMFMKVLRIEEALPLLQHCTTPTWGKQADAVDMNKQNKNSS